jgi:hypothetical protein
LLIWLFSLITLYLSLTKHPISIPTFTGADIVPVIDSLAPVVTVPANIAPGTVLFQVVATADLPTLSLDYEMTIIGLDKFAIDAAGLVKVTDVLPYGGTVSFSIRGQYSICCLCFFLLVSLSLSLSLSSFLQVVLLLVCPHGFFVTFYRSDRLAHVLHTS